MNAELLNNLLRIAVIPLFGIPVANYLITKYNVKSQDTLIVTGSLFVAIEQVNGGLSPCSETVYDIEMADISGMSSELYTDF